MLELQKELNEFTTWLITANISRYQLLHEPENVVKLYLWEKILSENVNKVQNK